MPTTSLDDWLTDTTPQPKHANVYREALLMGFTDRRAVANAIALAEAVAVLADRYPRADYDDLAELVLSEADAESRKQYQLLKRRWYLWLLLHHRYHTFAWWAHRPFRWLRRVLTPPARSRIEVER